MHDPEVLLVLGRLEGKVDMLVTSLPPLETRLRKLEGRFSKVVGASGVFGALLAFAAAHLSLPWSIR